MSTDRPTPTPGPVAAETLPLELRTDEHFNQPGGRWLWTALAIGLAGLCGLQLLAWVPHYLTWPWWADHDVFASAARGWSEGVVPYQDYKLNNFPGTIYLFWLLGTFFGWGHTLPLYAFDASLLLALGALLWFWSARVFGSTLPGIVGYALFLSYYLDLNYTLTAQRDWHAPFFLLTSLIVLQTVPGRAGWIVAGISAAIGISIRPQTMVFLPALMVALDAQVRQPGESFRKTIGPLSMLTIAGAGALTALFLPLIVAGAFDDFLVAIRTLAPDDTYSRLSIGSMLREGILQVSSVRLLGLPLVVALLISGSSRQLRRPARAWALAFVGALTYAPISPYPHLYLRHPLMLFWAMMGAVLVAMVIEVRRWPSATAVALVLLVLSSGVSLKPRFSDPGRSTRALAELAGGNSSGRTPMGYTSMALLPNLAARYDWLDYQAVLDRLRSLPSSTRVANALYGVPAIVGPSGLVSLFPAESLALLTMVREDAEEAFVNALQQDVQSVVVWSPSEVRSGRHRPLPRLFATIETLYEPDRRFGEIEVWRRRTGKPIDQRDRPPERRTDR